MADYKKVESDIKEKLVAINRITKVVKVGRRFGFAALMVVGNQKGSIGIGQGKSKQVPDAIKKATEDAKRNLIKIPLKDGRTLHHDVKGKNGAGKVVLRAAPAGTGIIAGGAIRSVCEVLGIQDVVAKSLGSANPHNVLKACVDGLKSQNSPKKGNHKQTQNSQKLPRIKHKQKSKNDFWTLGNVIKSLKKKKSINSRLVQYNREVELVNDLVLLLVVSCAYGQQPYRLNGQDVEVGLFCFLQTTTGFVVNVKRCN